jgi:hypothetical protein
VAPRRPPRAGRSSSSTRAWSATPRDPAERRRDELQRLLLRALARRVDEGRFSADDAVDVALVQIGRPGGPRLADDQKAALRRSLLLLAGALAPPTPRALHEFARDAARLAWQAEKPARSPTATLRDHAHAGDAAAAARAAVYAELLNARDSDDLVRRAVHRAIQERRQSLPGIAVPLVSGDPLRALLDLPAQGRVRLPRRDVRGTIARVAVDNAVVGDTLRKAARFARHVLQPALGDELWLLCRPIGFVDKAESRVLVAAESALGAQETQLRSRELVHRLQKLDGFAAVVAVRVVVDARAFRVDGQTAASPSSTHTPSSSSTSSTSTSTSRPRGPRSTR